MRLAPETAAVVGVDGYFTPDVDGDISVDGLFELVLLASLVLAFDVERAVVLRDDSSVSDTVGPACGEALLSVKGFSTALTISDAQDRVKAAVTAAKFGVAVKDPRFVGDGNEPVALNVPCNVKTPCRVRYSWLFVFPD